jgi:hypothetical protein
MSDPDLDLKRLQEFFYRLITAPSGVAEGLARESTLPPGGLDRLVAGDNRMTSAERVEIYATGYFYRILEVLKEDFPASLAVVGADNFHNLVTGYLVDYPPTEPSIYFAGKSFASFLAAHPLREQWPFLADLATLERATLDSFHAADAPALDSDLMRSIAPAEWPALKLRTHPATRPVVSAWRIDRLLRAVEDGDAWRFPDREDVMIIVSRRDARVSWRIAEDAERTALLLASADGGAAFSEVCEAIATDAHATDDVAALINRLFAGWLRDGLFVCPAD